MLYSPTCTGATLAMPIPMFRHDTPLAQALITSMLLAQGACSGPAPGGTADADIAGADSGFIGGEITEGIGLRFEVSPEFGETFEHNDSVISVGELEFTIVDLRLIGDAASGDDRTSKDVVRLSWEEDGPEQVGYGNAPAGMYSRVRGTVVEFSIDGEVEIEGGESVEYEAESDGVALPIDFALEFNLEAGGAETVSIEVDLQKIAEEIPFKELTIEDGSIEIEDDSEAMEKIEEKISESFSPAE